MSKNSLYMKTPAVVSQEAGGFPVPEFKPFTLPEVGNDPVDVYIAAIQEDAPFEEKTVANGLVNLSKYVLPSDYSYVGNEEKRYSYKLPVVALTKKQYEAVKTRIAETLVNLPMRKNPAHKDDPKKPEYLDPEQVRLVDYVIFCRVQDYRPSDNFMLPEVSKGEAVKPTETKEFTEQVQQSLYAKQGLTTEKEQKKKQ